MLTIDQSPVLPLLFAVYAATMATLWWRGRRYTLPQYAAMTAFVAYGLVVVGFVLLPIHVTLPVDANIAQYLSGARWRGGWNIVPFIHADARQFLMNVALFVPLGILLPLLLVRYESAVRVVRAGFMLSVAIEVAQYVIYVAFASGRSTDIDDVIANTLGAVVGYLVFRLLMRLGPIRRLIYQMRLPSG